MKLQSFLLLFCIGLSCLAEAQVVDRTERRARQKSQQRVDRKIDKGIDGALDAVEGLFQRKNKSSEENDRGQSNEGSNSERSASSSGFFSMGGGDVEVRERFDFKHTIDMEMEVYNRRGRVTDKVDMQMLYHDDMNHTAMTSKVEGQEALVIFDLQEKQMITLIEMEGEKVGMVMRMDGKSIEAALEDNADDKVSFVETGNREQISGFDCKEYLVEDEDESDVKITMWMSTDAPLDWMKTFAAVSQENQGLSKNKMPANYPKGSMIRMVTEEGSSGERSVMTVTRFGMNEAKPVSTKGYAFMSMNMGR